MKETGGIPARNAKIAIKTTDTTENVKDTMFIFNSMCSTSQVS